MVTLPFSLLDLGILLGLLSTFFLHLGLHLSPASGFSLYQHFNSLLSPFLLELFCLQLFRINRVLVLSNEQLSGICYTFVKMLTLFLINQGGLCFLQSIKGFGCLGIFGFVGMD